MATQAHSGLDFESLRRAIEGRDADTLLGFYADDAEVRTVNRSATPSSPQVLRGKGVLKARGAQEQVGSGEPLPDQPEHKAEP